MLAPPSTIDVAAHRLALYFDLFDHPLTVAELQRLCDPAGEHIERAVAALVERGILEAVGVYRPLRGRSSLVPTRRARAERSETLWAGVNPSVALLARLPYVRGALVTGSLSKNSADADSDIDFLVLVEPGHVWTVKSLVEALRRPSPRGFRESLCVNFLLATDALELRDRNVYTAIELATAVPVFGPDACTELMRANRWVESFVPGYRWCEERALRTPLRAPSRLKSLGESFLAGPTWDRMALRVWDAFWNRKYARLDEVTRKASFRREPSQATNYLHNYRSRVLAEVEQRWQAAGLL